MTKYKYCVLACLTMVLLSMLPQIHLWISRGHDWNGAYASPQGDEPLYSAYVNALVSGRTRKNDPFGGRDDSRLAPLPESHFSIQFVPAYAVVLIAKGLRIPTSSAFIVLLGLGALFGALSVFRLLEAVVPDQATAGAGTLFVLCAGWIVGRYGIFNTFFDFGIPALHFLRRYQPAAAFPLFFLFQLLVWRALHSNSAVKRWLISIFAGVILALLVYSYLYLWTGAAAWLICIVALWLIFRPDQRRRVITLLVPIVIIAGLAFFPYGYLLSQRSTAVDEQQLLVATHMPDVLRMHELLGGVILVLIAIAVRRRKTEWSQSATLYAASLAVLPFLVFNQQIISGRGIQPFHYEIFVVNYSTMVGVVVTVCKVWNFQTRRFLMLSAALSIALGIFAVVVPARLFVVPAAIENDRRVPVLLKLNQLSSDDGTLTDLAKKHEASTLVFSPDVLLVAWLPTWTSQPTLLDFTGVDCRGIARQERKQFFAMHLYYSGVGADLLRAALNGNLDRSYTELSSVRTSIFGYERTSPALTSDYEPIRPDDIDREVKNYETYINSFSREEVLKRPLTYAVIPTDRKFDFSNLDRWYERDAGERVGDYVLYRLKLRP